MKEIPLANGKGVALVDDEDYECLTGFSWWVNKCGKRSPDHLPSPYAAAWIRYDNGDWKHISMHRFIMKAMPGQTVDHKDRDGLNNQKSNLRLCTLSENLYNRRVAHPGIYRGVRKIGKKFEARAKINKKGFYIGVFDTAEDAAKAYDRCVYSAVGEFAVLNFPEILNEEERNEQGKKGQEPQVDGSSQSVG